MPEGMSIDSSDSGGQPEGWVPYPYPPGSYPSPPSPYASPPGSYPYPPGSYPYPPGSYFGNFAGTGYLVSKTNSLAVAALVCACMGPFFYGTTLVLGIILGFVARSQIKKSAGAQKGMGLAIAAIVIGFTLLFMVVMVILLVAIFGTWLRS